MKKVMTESKDDKRPDYFANNYAMMAAAFMVETERWDLAAKLFGAGMPDEQPAGEHSAHAAHSGASAQGSDRHSLEYQPGGSGLHAWAGGCKKGIRRKRKKPCRVTRFAQSGKEQLSGKVGGIRELEIAAVAASSKSKHSKAIELMKEARKLEDELAPPSGPPSLIKPAHELFGEILLGAGKAREAAEQFAGALLRQPNRARSLVGAARAAAQAGDSKPASECYGRFLKQWEQADSGLPELTEARDFLSRHPTP